MFAALVALCAVCRQLRVVPDVTFFRAPANTPTPTPDHFETNDQQVWNEMESAEHMHSDMDSC